jgi:hypothetical protein
MFQNTFLVIHSFCWAFTPFEIPYDPHCFQGTTYKAGEIVVVDQDTFRRNNHTFGYSKKKARKLYHDWKLKFFRNVQPYKIVLEK